MPDFISVSTPREESVLARQIAFAAAFLLPAGKLPQKKLPPHRQQQTENCITRSD